MVKSPIMGMACQSLQAVKPPLWYGVQPAFMGMAKQITVRMAMSSAMGMAKQPRVILPINLEEEYLIIYLILEEKTRTSKFDENENITDKPKKY